MKPQKKTIHGPIVTSVKDGQPYVDEPVYKKVPIYCAKVPMEGHLVRYYNRRPLRWINPDGTPKSYETP